MPIKLKAIAKLDFTIISYVRKGEFSWRALTRVGRLKCAVSHLGSSTRREILKRPQSERAVAAQECVYGNVTLPPPSFIVLHGDWRRGSAFRYMDCRPFRARVTYATYAIARVCAPRIRASVER